MSLVKQLIIGLVVCVLMFLGGYYAGKGDVQIEKVETIKTVEGQKEIQYRDRIVTVTKTVKPDGTVTEITKTEEKDRNEKTVTKSSDIANTTITTPVLARYALGAGLSRKADFTSILTPAIGDYYVEAGVRVFGPGWIQAGYQPTSNEIRLGVRVEL